MVILPFCGDIDHVAFMEGLRHTQPLMSWPLSSYSAIRIGDVTATD